MGALLAAVVVGVYITGLTRIYDSNPRGFWIMVVLGAGGAFLLIRALTARKRRRRKILLQPFPQTWRTILSDKVEFYQKLDEAGKARFEQDVQLFLGEKRVTGVNTTVDDEVRVLVAASAVIPIFGFPEWEYRNLQEVLIYPGAFHSHNFAQDSDHGNALGMVGTGPMDRKMILSKTALLNGFVSKRDGKNTGLHEFVHLIDGMDGAFDGIPALAGKAYCLPWMEMIRQEMARIHRGKSELRRYGGTNPTEFFAVASEHFFENPQELKAKHPELYNMLTEVFHQDMRRYFSASFKRKERERQKSTVTP